jgi:hypothetical protein
MAATIANGTPMSIRDLTTSVAAFGLAALTPALVLGGVAFTVVVDRAVPLALLALFISVGHAVVLGLPLFLIFRSMGWISAISCIAGGAIVGVLPVGLLAWPFRPGNGTYSSFNGVVTVVNGIPTVAGWLSYLQFLAFLGAFGALAGLVFWLALKLGGYPITCAPEKRDC